MPKIEQIEGLRQELDASTKAYNFENKSINNEAEFSHNIGTNKLYVEFYDDGTRVNRRIDWEPTSSNKIKVYLPVGVNSWQGDIFIIKRS